MGFARKLYPDLKHRKQESGLQLQATAKPSCLPFNLKSRTRRWMREKEDPNSTCVDSAIQILEQNLDLESLFSSISIGLHYIKGFLMSVRYWSSTAHPRPLNFNRFGDVVSRIEDAFETAGLEIGNAIEKADAELLNTVRCKLRNKITLFRAIIRKTYNETHMTSWIKRRERRGLFGVIGKISKEYYLDYEEAWLPVRKGLEYIETFVIITFYWGSSDRAIRYQVKDLASSIHSSVITANEDIETAVTKGDAESLHALSANASEKIKMWKPQIKEAYDFLDHTFHFITPRLPLKHDFTLDDIGHLIVNNAKGVLYSLWDDDDDDGLRRSFDGIVCALKTLGQFFISKKHDDEELRALGFLLQWTILSVARILFLGWVEDLNPEDVLLMISDALQRAKPTSPEVLEWYMHYLSAPTMLHERDLGQLVVIFLPPSKSTSIQVLRDGLEYLLQPEHVKLLRLDIEELLLNVACLSYSYLIAAHDDDELLVQFLQKIELLRLELVFTSPNSIRFDSVYAGLSAQIFLVKAPDVYSERLVLIYKLMEQMAAKVYSLDRASLSAKSLYLGFKLLKIQAILMEQMRCSPCLMPLFHDRIETLYQGLELLFKYFSFLPAGIQSYEELILTYMERVDTVKTPPYYFSKSDQVPQYFINRLSDFFTTAQQEVHLMNSEIQCNVLKFQTSLALTFPMTSQGLGFVDIFLEKLSGLIEHEADSIGVSMKHQIEEVLKELGSLRSFLVKVGENQNGDPEIKTIQGRIIRAAYEAEYLIDWVLLVKCEWNCMLWLSNVIEDMKELNSKSEEFLLKTKKVKNGGIQASGQMIIAQATSPTFGADVISLEDQENIIINRLTDGMSERRVVTISGMPGIGKTTLAKKVYDNPRIRNYFKKIAWCCVSQVYRRRELLYKLLRDVTELGTDEMDKKNDEQLLDILYQSLKKIEYLVVMDDVWETQAWDEMKNVFPDDKNGSRILFTTRNENLGIHSGHGSAPHTLRFLNVDESWKLLQKIVFPAEECPEELEGVGLDIAKGCKGLPLSIIAIAGVLKTTEMKAEWWKDIKNDLNLRILQSPDIQCMGILELSYNHLPNHLKPCFLYFAAFGEDNEVPIQKLMQFWIAEGFIGHGHQKSKEDVAESYVANLIARSLIMPTKLGSNGRVKACKVHDMLYKLCSKKVDEDNFLQYENWYDKLFPSSRKKFDYGVVDSEYPPISVAYDRHRLSISSKRKHFVMIEPSGFPVRALLFSATSDSYPGYAYPELVFTIDKFKILSILDIECINIGSSFPKKIESIHPLRYLALSGDLKSVPSTIAKLWNLETLIVKGLAGDVAVALPDTLWSMSKLRHLHVSTRATFSVQDIGSIESSSKLDNMVSLSCPALSHGDNSLEMMKLFPNLQKLRCTFSESLQYSMEGTSFPALDFLEKLESLKMIYYGRLSCKLKGISFPSKLKKLSLSEFSFTWDDFSVIGKLLNLKILKLESIIFESSTWEMNDDEFQQLEYLKLDSLEIREWYVEDRPLPHLQQLVLRSCNMLEEVPYSFGNINTLQMIELERCNASTVESVMNIHKKKIEYSNDIFKAVIDGLNVVPLSSSDDS